MSQEQDKLPVTIIVGSNLSMLSYFNRIKFEIGLIEKNYLIRLTAAQLSAEGDFSLSPGSVIRGQ